MNDPDWKDEPLIACVVDGKRVAITRTEYERMIELIFFGKVKVDTSHLLPHFETVKDEE
jgi:hypothetical protein